MHPRRLSTFDLRCRTVRPEIKLAMQMRRGLIGDQLAEGARPFGHPTIHPAQSRPGAQEYLREDCPLAQRTLFRCDCCRSAVGCPPDQDGNAPVCLARDSRAARVFARAESHRNLAPATLAPAMHVALVHKWRAAILMRYGPP